MIQKDLAAPALVYEQRLLEDHIVGTREQLLALGVGVGELYPGDPGADGWLSRVHDPRGFEVSLMRGRDGRFSAWVKFDGLPERPNRCGPIESFCDGVTRRTIHDYADEFAGAKDALIAAGLVAPGQFPGDPGRLKTSVTIYPSGEVDDRRMAAGSPLAKVPGAKNILRVSRRTYRVRVYVSMEEAVRRRAVFQQADDQWVAAVRALPRPARLLDLSLLSRQRGQRLEFVRPQAKVVNLSAWRTSKGRNND